MARAGNDGALARCARGRRSSRFGVRTMTASARGVLQAQPARGRARATTVRAYMATTAPVREAQL
eukprot:400752-Pleurochrysis_carterae.AAC.1